MCKDYYIDNRILDKNPVFNITLYTQIYNIESFINISEN